MVENMQKEKKKPFMVKEKKMLQKSLNNQRKDKSYYKETPVNTKFFK